MRPFSIILMAAAILPAAEPADWIVSARYVVTMDPQRRIIDNGAIAVREGRIAAVGTRAEIDRAWTAKQRLDRTDDILLPGLISTHTHAPMSLMRGIADDLRLEEWLQKFIFPAEAKNVDPDFVRWGTRLACLEMLLSGTTTYTDMYYYEEIIGEETKAAGMRGVLGQTILGFPTPDSKTPQDGLARTEVFLKRFRNDPLIVPAVAPHALYTNSDETLRASRELANKYSVPLLIHLSETKRENEQIGAKRGKSPTAVLDELGIFEGRTLAAHGVWLDDQDIETLARRGTGVAHCPSSNLKLASGIAPLPKMLARGIAVGLGPDGPAGSNNDFDLMEEMDLAAKIHKGVHGDPTLVTALQALEMATISGARALGMEKNIGSLETGKLADFITLRLGAPHTVPLFQVYSQIVYALKGSDVRDVFVHGKQLVRDRAPLTLNTAAIVKQAAVYQQKVAKSIAAPSK